MRGLHNGFCRQGRVNNCEVNFNHACTVHAFTNITAIDVICSFNAICIYSHRRDFAMQFRNDEDVIRDNLVKIKKNLESMGIGTRLVSVRKRSYDKETYFKIIEIVSNNCGTSSKIKARIALLRKFETLNSILNDAIYWEPPYSSSTLFEL